MEPHATAPMLPIKKRLSVGQRGRIEWNGVEFYVEVMGVRSRYGHTDLLISPLSGVGQRWVEHTKVEPLN